MEKMSLRDRFEKKINKNSDGCWLWTGSLNNKGYGWFSKTNKARLAHRVSWEIYKGEIPKRMNVLHKCDIRNCVNPDHLFLGTLMDNMKDCFNKGRLSINWPRCNGEQHKMSKLTEADVRNIRNSERLRGYGPRLANQYKVSPNTIYDVVKGRIWAHI